MYRYDYAGILDHSGRFRSARFPSLLGRQDGASRLLNTSTCDQQGELNVMYSLRNSSVKNAEKNKF